MVAYDLLIAGCAARAARPDPIDNGPPPHQPSACAADIPRGTAVQVTFKRGQLRYFVTAAEEGQLTRAAAKLQIAQPALSQAIAQLESELGVQLLERHARGVTLTPNGEAFLKKARVAVASEREARLAAESLSREATGVLEVGFIGPPPILSTPELFAAFTKAHPGVEISLRDLPFPRGTTTSWLRDVDVAFSHPPALEPGVAVQAVRIEPRALLLHSSHPLVQRKDLMVAEVLDETFVGYHPDVQPTWAGFHTFDDHRGGPPRAITVDRAESTMQMVAILTLNRRAITVAPLSDAKLGLQLLPELVVMPLPDANPAVPSLTWRTATENALVRDLVALAAELAEGA